MEMWYNGKNLIIKDGINMSKLELNECELKALKKFPTLLK